MGTVASAFAGYNDVSLPLATRVRDHPELCIRVPGFVDDRSVNVVAGTMSILGPRPHAVAHNEEYRKLIKGYMVRHKVRPGMTGLAQAGGFRGETQTLDEKWARIEYDLECLRSWSPGLDLKIIARTALLLLTDRKA